MHDEATARRRDLVDWMVREGRVHDPRVEDALRAVPRDVFLPGASLDVAYADEAIPVKQTDGRVISSASQPSMVAIMLEQLDLRPGHRVLEIGAGTGYNAALMAHLVGSTGVVTTLDLDADLVAQAARNLDAAGFRQVRVVRGDGAYGYSPDAPYDRIVLTVGAADVSPAWVEQLAPSGRLVLPLAIRVTQRSLALEPRGDHLECVSSFACGFVPLRGLLAGPESHLDVETATATYYLVLADAERVDPERLADHLRNPSAFEPTGLVVGGAEVYDGLVPWLELESSDVIVITAGQSGLLPVGGGLRSTIGLLDSDGFALLGWRESADTRAAELAVQGFGQAERAVGALVSLVGRWDALGRPGSGVLGIRIYPADVDYRPLPGEHVVSKRWSTVVLDWRRPSGTDYV
jgi:protein-L-isoaspartate(D-aspartate) O-methyltransferase